MIFDLILLALILGVKWWIGSDMADIRNHLHDINGRITSLEFQAKARRQREDLRP